jgi:hypothetical protein
MTAPAFAAALSIGSVHAAPGFGPSSHRVGGAVGAGKSATTESKPQSIVESLFALIGLDLSASAKVEPVVGEAYPERAGGSKECDQEKTTEVAKVDSKDEKATGAKGRTRTGEPVYLAF